MIETRIDSEEYAYRAKWGRKATVILTVILRANPHNPIQLPYGKVRTVRAGIPDTFFSIPAMLAHKPRKVRGFISTPHDGIEGVLYFTPEAEPTECQVCTPGEGCRMR